MQSDEAAESSANEHAQTAAEAKTVVRIEKAVNDAKVRCC